MELNSEPRFYTIDGPKLQRCRKWLGWSQVDLGRRAGYSERVVRKAEAGGSLRLETIQHLAEALSNDSVSVTTNDLIQDNVSVARNFVECYDRYGRDMLKFYPQYLDDAFEFEMRADTDQIPFAGVWQGTNGFQEFLDRFFGTYSRHCESLKPIYLVGADQVQARYEETLFYKGHELPAVWVNLHFQLRNGRILRIVNEHDTLSAARSLSALRARLAPPRMQA